MNMDLVIERAWQALYILRVAVEAGAPALTGVTVVLLFGIGWRVVVVLAVALACIAANQWPVTR